jgi:lysophospholipase L1-like esterase
MRILFLGDSITAGFDPSIYFPGEDIINKGISGLDSMELLEGIQHEWFASNPEIVFLCIGTNDLARDNSPEQIIIIIGTILEEIKKLTSPACRIFLTSLFPTRHNPPRPNPGIRKLNLQLHRLAYETDVEYLHLHTFFTDTNGMMHKDFTEDGLHLNHLAYQHWREIIRILLS